MRYNTVVSYNFTVEHDGEEPTEKEIVGGFLTELMLLGLKTNSMTKSDWLTPLPKAKKHHFQIWDDRIEIEDVEAYTYMKGKVTDE
jgi:hypothetical protein|tara:strand:- start:81 stop:338 length:258 start_codon:yes stop_codon:yes gene_type:complete